MEQSDKVFRFYINKNETKPYFEGNLQKEQCRYIKPNGEHCKRMTVIGIPFCPQHLAIELHLKIKKSLIPHSGKGVFCFDQSKGENEIIFRPTGPTRIICEYDGELINLNTLNERYKYNNIDFTGPYAFKINDNTYIDGALRRGIGTMINHTNWTNANCKFVRYQNSNRVRILAKKNIRNGQELLICYGDQYFFDEPTHYSTR
jgi:hypothetical protein